MRSDVKLDKDQRESKSDVTRWQAARLAGVLVLPGTAGRGGGGPVQRARDLGVLGLRQQRQRQLRLRVTSDGGAASISALPTQSRAMRGAGA